MKHLEPLMTYLSPMRTAVVRIPDTSEPASGSVRQNEASLKSSVSMPRYCFLSSSEAATESGAEARPLAPSEVVMPEQPQDSSSSMMHPSRYEPPGPPYSSGMCEFISPSSQPLRSTSSGQVPSRSYSQATGRISFWAKSCAISRSAFCSSVSVKSTTVVGSSIRARLTGQSTAVAHGTANRGRSTEERPQHERDRRNEHDARHEGQRPLVREEDRPPGRHGPASKSSPHRHNRDACRTRSASSSSPWSRSAP